MDCLPVRPLIKTSTEDGAWIVAKKAAERKRFKAIICALRVSKNDFKTDKSNCSELTGKRREFSCQYILDNCCTQDPNKIALISLNMRNLEPSNDIFDSFTSTYKIEANGNYLNFDLFISFPYLQILHLAGNNIDQINTSELINYFTHLSELDLSYNSLSGEEIKKLSVLRQLKYLNIAGNNLQTLPIDFVQYKTETDTKLGFIELEELNLSDNLLNNPEIFAILASLRKLKYLNISKNYFNEIPLLKFNGQLLNNENDDENYYQNSLPSFDETEEFDYQEDDMESLEMMAMNEGFKSNFIGIRIPSTLPEVEEETDKSTKNQMSSDRLDLEMDEELDEHEKLMEDKYQEYEETRANEKEELEHKENFEEKNLNKKIDEIVDEKKEEMDQGKYIDGHEVKEQNEMETNEKEKKVAENQKEDSENSKDMEDKENTMQNKESGEINDHKEEMETNEENVKDKEDTENNEVNENPEEKDNHEDSGEVNDHKEDTDNNKDMEEKEDIEQNKERENDEDSGEVNDYKEDTENNKDMEEKEDIEQNKESENDEDSGEVNDHKENNDDMKDKENIKNNEKELTESVEDDVEHKDNDKEEDHKEHIETNKEYKEYENNNEEKEQKEDIENDESKELIEHKNENAEENENEDNKQNQKLNENDSEEPLKNIEESNENEMAASPIQVSISPKEKTNEYSELLNENENDVVTELKTNQTKQYPIERSGTILDLKMNRENTIIHEKNFHIKMGFNREITNIFEDPEPNFINQNTDVAWVTQSNELLHQPSEEIHKEFSIVQELNDSSITDIIRYVSGLDSSLLQSIQPNNIQPFENLEFLDISYNKINSERVLIPVISFMNLKTLRIYENPLTLSKSQKSSFIKSLLEKTFKIHVDWLEPVTKNHKSVEINTSKINTSDVLKHKLSNKKPLFLTQLQESSNMEKSFLDQDQNTKKEQKELVSLPRQKTAMEIIKTVDQELNMKGKLDGHRDLLPVHTTSKELEILVSNEEKEQQFKISRDSAMRSLRFKLEHPITYFERNIELYNKQRMLEPIKKKKIKKPSDAPEKLKGSEILELQKSRKYQEEYLLYNAIHKPNSQITRNPRAAKQLKKDADHELQEMQSKYDKIREKIF